MEKKELETMTNEKALELFSILNSISISEGTHRGEMQARTLRSMKPWFEDYNEKVQVIDLDNCATYENDKGQQVLLKETMQRTKTVKGVDTKEEYQVNVYTKDSEKKRQADLRELLKKPVSVKFKIFTTSDGADLTIYNKITLEELGFLVKEEDKKTQ